MSYTAHYVLNDAQDGEERTYAADHQDLIEAHIAPFIAAGTLVQAQVYDSHGVAIAESRAGAPGLRRCRARRGGWTGIEAAAGAKCA